MMPINKIHEAIFARTGSERVRTLNHWRTVQPVAPELPAPDSDNVIEIIHSVTTANLRSDGRRVSGSTDQTTETVLMRLHVDDVPHLIQTLVQASMDALDGRTWAQAQAPIITEQDPPF